MTQLDEVDAQGTRLLSDVRFKKRHKDNMKSTIILLVLSTLTGCSSVITITPPEKQNFESSRVYNKSYDVVWLKAIDWFADHNVVIEKIEKDSGLITAKYQIDVSSSDYLDHGKIENSGMAYINNIEEYGSLNVTIRKVDVNKTKASVNFFGTYVLHARDEWNGKDLGRTGKSISTGKLETSILNYIQAE